MLYNEGIKIGEKRGIEIGEKRGIKIGEKRGRKSGIKKGKKLGELKVKKEMVLSMAAMGYPLKQIVQVVKVNAEEVHSWIMESRGIVT